jgi:hypothetical protein
MIRTFEISHRDAVRRSPREVPTEPRNTRRVLAALGSDECASLRRILPTGDWSLRLMQNMSGIQAELQSSAYGVVICEGGFGHGGCWKDLLGEVQRMPRPPQVIVADRLAGEALWAEVLNFGGYDLLPTPFEPETTLRVVSMAWEFWKREQERAAAK